MGSSIDRSFTSDILELSDFNCSDSNIKKEPMFFNSDLAFALEYGGEITKSFLTALPGNWKKEPLVFDSRVHMLMPGWYPAIPGWHHDDVPRAIIPPGQHFITAGQPDYDNPRYRSEHIMGLVNAHICPTQFIIGECPMPNVPDGELIYRKWHIECEKLIESSKVKVVEAPSNKLIYFNCDTFHTGQKAVHHGWRWFGRVSRHTERTSQITNEIRNQVQVYLEFPMEGW